MLIGVYGDHSVVLEENRVILKPGRKESTEELDGYYKLPPDITKGYDIYIKREGLNIRWYLGPVYHNILPLFIKNLKTKDKRLNSINFWEVSYDIFIHILSSIYNTFSILNLPGIQGIEYMVEEVWKLKENVGVDIWNPSPRYPDYFTKVLSKRSHNLNKGLKQIRKFLKKISLFLPLTKKQNLFFKGIFKFHSIHHRIDYLLAMLDRIIQFWISFPENNPIIEVVGRKFKYRILRFEEFIMVGLIEEPNIVIYDAFSFVRREILNRLKTFSLEEGLSIVFLSILGSGVHEGTRYTLEES